ncbi:MAG: sulfite exporter TauE/SafE family protein [Candidatus Bathyarchaeia archaeon]
MTYELQNMEHNLPILTLQAYKLKSFNSFKTPNVAEAKHRIWIIAFPAIVAAAFLFLKETPNPSSSYPLIGFITGILVGVSGVGAGSILTPTLILGFGVTPLIAVGTDLIHSFLMKSIGSMKHHNQRTVDRKLTKRLLIGAAPASLIGALLTSHLAKDSLNQVNGWITLTLSALLTLTGVLTLFQTFNLVNSPYRKPLLSASSSAYSAVAIMVGFLVGFLVSVTSVGGGALLMPFLLTLFPISLRQVVGTDISVAAVLTAIPGLTYLYFGAVNLRLLGLLLIGSVPGILIGSSLNHRAPNKAIRLLLGVILTSLGLIMIWFR